MKSVSSRSNPMVTAYRTLAQAPDPDGVRMLLDGVHLIRDARDAGLSFESVAVVISALDAGDESATLARALETEGQPVVAVTEPVLRALSPVAQPSGVVAIARRATPVTDRLVSEANAFFCVVASVQDPGNMGAVVRVAESGGVSQVVACGASAHPLGWRALRGSMGSALRLPLARTPELAHVLGALRASGARVVAAVPRGGRAPDKVDWRGHVALLLGGEGPGLPEDIVAATDSLVTIPMQPPVESLNVAVAAAVLIYAARRQRA